MLLSFIRSFFKTKYKCTQHPWQLARWSTQVDTVISSTSKHCKARHQYARRLPPSHSPQLDNTNIDLIAEGVNGYTHHKETRHSPRVKQQHQAGSLVATDATRTMMQDMNRNCTQPNMQELDKWLGPTSATCLTRRHSPDMHTAMQTHCRRNCRKSLLEKWELISAVPATMGPPRWPVQHRLCVWVRLCEYVSMCVCVCVLISCTQQDTRGRCSHQLCDDPNELVIAKTISSI